MEEETIEEKKSEPVFINKRCSCYDEDCEEVKDHYRCFIGISSSNINIGIADGYCPYIHMTS